MKRFLLFLGACAIGILAAHPVFADELGQNTVFMTDAKYDVSGATSISATLRAVGQDAYWYVDDRYWQTLSPAQQVHYMDSLTQLSSQFDSVIHPKSIALWGSENTPGVDNDSHVVILLERLTSTAGGYFETINNYPKNVAPQGNAREMIYISADGVPSGDAPDYIAHEFQHLISFYQKNLLQDVNDDIWSNEGRSEYNITNVGFNDPFSGSTLEHRMWSFVRAPSDSLVEWPNTAADYGIATVFVHYLADRFGPDILSSTMHILSAGVPEIDTWLAQANQSERFPNVFTDWMAASYFNDRSLGDGYGYVRPGLDGIHIVPQQAAQLGSGGQYTGSIGIKEWQPVWLQFGINADVSSPAFNIHIAGQVGPWWGGTALASYADGSRMSVPFGAGADGQSAVSVPVLRGTAHLVSVVLAITQGMESAADSRTFPALPVSITASFGDSLAPIPVAPAGLINGDLIRHGTEAEIYVVWGPYRRYLPTGVLALYGFENRPVTSVNTDTFIKYTTSNYVRSINDTKVYALWPDGTKHWLNITPAQWDASGRDWNAIFIVNDLEINFYKTGPDITR